MTIQHDIQSTDLNILRYMLPLVMVFASLNVNAKFYVWYEEDGTKHISNVPRHCISEHKTISFTCQVTLSKADVEKQASAWNESQSLPVNKDANNHACSLADSTYKQAMAKYDNLPSNKKTSAAQMVIMGLAADADEKCGGSLIIENGRIPET